MKKIVSIVIALVAAGLFWAFFFHFSKEETAKESLVIYSAAGLKAPLDAIVKDYIEWSTATRGISPKIQVHYGGSGDLLARMQAGLLPDLYLAADSLAMDIAIQEGLVREVLPVARMVPVIALSREGSSKISSPEELFRPGVRFGIGHPKGTAIGRSTKSAYEKLGQWTDLEKSSAVTKTTVNELALDLQVGSLDAAIIWDALAKQFGLASIPAPHLSAETTLVSTGVTSQCANPREALRFARFLTAPEKGNTRLVENYLTPVPGDRWSNQPEIIVFSGAINRKALARVLDAFAEREDVLFRTTYNGCGILTSQMKVFPESTHEAGFPDLYVACDVYYLTPVDGFFRDELAVSKTDIVLVVAPGNPKGIHRLEDLTKPGVRVVLGNAEYCTIGALTRRLLQVTGLYDRVLPNVVEQTTSSALLVPAVLTGAADAVLAYKTDTLGEADRLEVIAIDHPLARAVQPIATSVQTPYPGITARFYRFFSDQSRAYSEEGFNWIFGEDPKNYEVVEPGAADPQ